MNGHGVWRPGSLTWRTPVQLLPMMTVAVVVATVVVAALLGHAVHPISPNSGRALQAGWTLLEDAEDPSWPASSSGLWTAAGGPSGTAVRAWTSSACQAKHDKRSLRAFGSATGLGGTDLPCSDGAPANTTSTVVLNLDLRAARNASRLEIDFDAWLGLAPGGTGSLTIYLRAPQPDGSVLRVPVFAVSGSSRNWMFPQRILDLINLIDVTKPGRVYDLRGGQWQLEWVAATSDALPGGGIYIDDVYLIWEPLASFPTATPRPGGPVPTSAWSPTTTPGATQTPSPLPRTSTPTAPAITRTSQPTDEPTSTPPGGPPTPDGTPRPLAPAYLPFAVNNYPEPTPTPTETATETPDPNATATAETTATPSSESPTPKAEPPTLVFGYRGR